METLTFTVDKTSILLSNYTMPRPYLTGKNTDYLCVFQFSEDWTGLTKSANFYNTFSELSETRLLSQNTYRIPSSVLTYGDLEISVFGKSGGKVVKSSLPFRIPVERDGSENAGDTPAEIDQSLFEQIMAKLEEVDCGVVSARFDPEDHHLYLTLTNDTVIDAGIPPQSGLVNARTDENGRLVLIYADGEEVVSDAYSLQPPTDGNVNDVMQITSSGWQSQPLVLDDDTVHILTNSEIEQLLDNFV